jgi:signal transduction histidine kinase
MSLERNPGMTDTTKNWRHLLPLFLATTVVPLACLGWLAWRVVTEDGQQQRSRVQEQRDQAAELAASALQRVFAEAEERLASFSAAPDSRRDLAAGAALIALSRGGTIERAGTPLPYYPIQSESAEPEPAIFAPADDLENQKNNPAAGLHILEGLSESRDPDISGGALLRIARVQKKLGKISAALDSFTKLGALDNVRVSGLPAKLVALQGRALIFDSLGRRGDLEREASAICDGLESGRWVLSHGEFDFSYYQARKWLSSPRPPIDTDRLALAQAAEMLWQNPEDLESRSRSHTLRIGETSIVILTRAASGRRTALLIGPQFLESAWLNGLRSASDNKSIDFSLLDDEGRTVLGPTNAPASPLSTRAVPPWTVQALTRENNYAASVSNQTKLVLTGIVMMALLTLAAGYLVHRSILRELRVARLQSDFVAAVSHEFRTPLTTLRQLSEMLVKGRVSSDERRQLFYETLLRESERLHKLVEGLLNFGRIESGQLKYRFEPVDPQKLLQDIVSDFEREVAGRGYHVELHGDSGLPAIRADRESLERVFWNLLDNAVKYSPDNHTIEVDLSNGGRRVAVRVQDHGIGIPAAEQKKIFQKFVRGEASKDASIQGTGVGLAMAQQIVAAHGGDISVESRPGEGSVFTVLLPVAEK